MNNESKLALLGYSQKWLDYGILSLKRLEADITDFNKAPYEHNKEHYRAATLYHFIDTQDKFTDSQIEEILELAEDSCIAHHLFKSPLLSDRQFENFTSYKYIDSSDFSTEVFARQKLIRLYWQEGATAQVLEESVRQKYGKLQRQLLEEHLLSLEQIRQLAQNGANKAIRNISSVMLKKANNTKNL